MGILLPILLFLVPILVLSFLVIIHEIGHFLAAKWAGVAVEEFGLGYPPKARKLFHKWDTDFTLNWIPFGGFVKMKGEDAITDEPSSAKDAFYEKSAFKRLVVILAGATINFIFGVLAFTIVYSFSGIPTAWEEPRIIAIQPNSPAATAQIPTEVNIVSIKSGDQQYAVKTRAETTEIIQQHRGKTIMLGMTGHCEELACQESYQEREVYVRTAEEVGAGQGAMGIEFQTSYFKFYPWYEMPFRSAAIGITQALGVGQYILQSLGGVVSQGIRDKVVPQDLKSPFGIVDEIGQSGVIQEGWLAVLHLAGMISINLAILNVMPIPALDGGRAAFIIIGQFIKHKAVATLENYVNYAGLLLLVALLLFLSFRDISSIVTRYLWQ